ncbi:MAG: hypothetical protein FGM24_05805 [Candidatus Kapabacteria bacterium]|nr:hypothetical protein [Candidatus Kapabacteria bacterium]
MRYERLQGRHGGISGKTSAGVQRTMRLSTIVVDLLYNAAMAGASLMLPAIGSMHRKLHRRTSVERALVARLRPADKRMPCIWAHAASMGELEQLVPILERLRSALPSVRIVVTCTSPSGLEHAQRLSTLIDDAAYLPVDTRANASMWMQRVAPDLVLIDRYDLWRNHVLAADKLGIPICVVNATAPSRASGFTASWLADTYRRCRWITAVTDDDANTLAAWLGTDVPVLPDTRADRVLDRIRATGSLLAAYRRTEGPTIVLGSSWREDESVVLRAMQTAGFKGRCIIVPHEPTEDALRSVEERVACTRWSMATPDTSGHLLVDSVGQLLGLYALADAAWVGGGFGVGVHSLAEPAAYGIPLACGPNIGSARDAAPLIKAEALTLCRTSDETAAWLRSVVCDVTERRRRGDAARDYIVGRTGSSDILVDRLLATITGALAH